jgi:hypothetical protein
MATPDPMAHLRMAAGVHCTAWGGPRESGHGHELPIGVHPPPSGRILSSSSSSGQDERPKETTWSGPPIGVNAPFTHSSTSGSRSVASVAAGAGPDSCRARSCWAETDVPADKMARAWARRNSPHVGPIRRGAGPRPWRRSTFAIVVAETLTPLDELAFDPQVAPPGVLPAHAKDRIAQRGVRDLAHEHHDRRV